MALTPVTDPIRVRDTFSVLKASAQRDAVHARRTIGWQGGNEAHDVYWHPAQAVWISIREPDERGRYWCWFGTADPTVGSPVLNITCEVNFPTGGINRRVSGILAEEGGHIFLVHSGKIGGGRPGIGQTAFLDFLGEDASHGISWPDGKLSKVVPVARAQSPLFVAEAANFVRMVARFKAVAVAGELESNADAFSPEFAGMRQGYVPKGEVEPRVIHGLVVNDLRDLLVDRGLTVGNDRHRDLFVRGRAPARSALFEVKTNVDPSSLYAGVGQLMLHSAIETPQPLRVLVLPEEPSAATRYRLDALGIRVMLYELEREAVLFPTLDSLCRHLSDIES